MKSEELNKNIRELDGLEEFEITGGKCIPYVGWFWRDVDFDSTGCWIGIIPGEFQGFMENNKWGYDGFWVKGEDWENLKKILEITLNLPSKESTKFFWNLIQKLKKKDAVQKDGE